MLVTDLRHIFITLCWWLALDVDNLTCHQRSVDTDADTDITNFETADMDADTDITKFWIADTDADMDIENFQIADKDADTGMTFSKNRGHGHDADKPRTRVSTDLCLPVESFQYFLLEWLISYSTNSTWQK